MLAHANKYLANYCCWHSQMSIILLILLFLYFMLESLGKVITPDQRIDASNMRYRYVDENITRGVFHTYNLSTPFVADAMIYELSGWKLLVIISASHLPRSIYNLRGTFLLFYDGKYVKGEGKLLEQKLLLMKYNIDLDDKRSFVFTIVNNENKLFYPNCTAKVLPHHVKQGIATCSMATNYDTFYDIANFITFNLYAGVDTVILYCSRQFTYIPVLHFLFGKRLKIVYFLPTRDISFGHYDVLLAQLNSCYYRNRDQYKYLIMVDLDEMLFNHTNMTLIDLIDSLLKSPKYNAINVNFNTIIYV